MAISSLDPKTPPRAIMDHAIATLSVRGVWAKLSEGRAGPELRCMLTALPDINLPNPYACYEALNDELEARGKPRSIGRFNDDPATTLPLVLEVLRAARDRLPA